MKILLVHDFNPFSVGGGVETNTRYLSFELQRMGNEVAIGHQDKFGVGTIPNLRTIPIGNLESMTNAFNEFDCIILMGSMSLRPLFLIGSQILIKQKRKFIVYFRATSSHRPFSDSLDNLIDLEVEKMDEEMANVLSSPYSVIVVNSQAMKKDLLKTYPDVSSKEIYISFPGGVWPKKIPLLEKPSDDKFIFINVGGMFVDKGGLFLWEAFYHLHNELSNMGYKRRVELHMVGGGELVKTFHSLTEEFHLSDSIFFYGNVEHEKVFENMSKSHLLVHPTLTESFGNVIIEALGIGLPVISSDFEGTKEILENGGCGVLIPRANSWKLKEAIKEIVINDKSYKEIYNNVDAVKIREKYNISNQAKVTLDIITREKIRVK